MRLCQGGLRARLSRASSVRASRPRVGHALLTSNPTDIWRKHGEALCRPAHSSPAPCWRVLTRTSRVPNHAHHYGRVRLHMMTPVLGGLGCCVYVFVLLYEYRVCLLSNLLVGQL